VADEAIPEQGGFLDKRLLSLAGAAVLSLCGYAHAATQLQIDTARTKAAAWLILNQKGDGNWSSGHDADISVTAQVTAGLLASGVKGYPVNTAGAWLGNADAHSIDALSRQIRVKAVPFASTSFLHDRLLASKSYADRSIWGSYPQYGTSFADTGLAILATVPFNYPTQSSELEYAVYCNILPRQTAAGGWPHTPLAAGVVLPSASGGAVLPTVMTVLALKAVRTKFTWDSKATCGESYSIATALQKAATWLRTVNGDGGIGENGNSTVLATALGYQGIRSVNSTDSALPALVDYLIARQSANGSWGGEPFQTGLVLEQLAPLATAMVDTDGDGIPDAIETTLGSNPAVADSRYLANQGNGNDTPGVETSVVLATTAIVNQSFSYGLTQPVGVQPFTWSLTGGSLPPGLALASSGAISGVPSQLGSYAFQYASTDSGAPPITRSSLGVIDVVRSAPGNGDLNGDGKVDLADLIIAQRIALKKIVPTPAQLSAGDVAPDGDPDGVIDAADVAWIAREILQLR
jgi:hypothetical protein